MHPKVLNNTGLRNTQGYKKTEKAKRLPKVLHIKSNTSRPHRPSLTS